MNKKKCEEKKAAFATDITLSFEELIRISNENNKIELAAPIIREKEKKPIETNVEANP